MTATPGWHRGRMTAFDTESTGIDTTTDRIVTATVAIITPGHGPQLNSWLLNPGIDIPEQATAIHGVTTEHAQEHGQDPLEALPAIANAVAAALRDRTPLVAFNVAYDLTLLDHELARHDLPSLADHVGGRVAPIVDPLVIDRQVDRYRKGSRKLVDACRHYRVALDGAHNAAQDALAAARLAWRLAETYSEIVGGDVFELHDLQIEWHHDWAENFQNHLRSKGQRDAVIDGTWPYRPAQRETRAVAS